MAAKTSSIFSTKRIQIDKANATMVMAIAISSFIVVFSIVAVKALWSQRGYQQRVIAKKETARDQLKKNVEAAHNLETAYQSFVGQPQNIIGGNAQGSGPKDGDNAKIILDALPSKYDFPALANSIDHLFNVNGVKVTTLAGTDDELNQEKNTGSNNPQPVPIPFTVSVTGNYDSIKGLITTLERSIKPIKINTMLVNGSDNELTVSFAFTTYYQPAKSLSISTVEVK